MNDHIKFVVGASSDITALDSAKADEADRVLLMPYTKWYDYRVIIFIITIIEQPSDEGADQPSSYDQNVAISLLTFEHYQKNGMLNYDYSTVNVLFPRLLLIIIEEV